MSEVTITTENFEQEVLQSELPVLVDFWATWCGPCKMLAPVVEQIANEYQGIIKVGKVNVDEEQPLAMQFGIMSIPNGSFSLRSLKQAAITSKQSALISL